VGRPLNFLHLTTFYPPYSFGGDAMYIYRLCHALGDAGHHVDVVHCYDSYHLLHPAKPPLEFREHPNVARHELRSGFGWLSPLLTQQTGRPLLKRKTIDSLLARRAYDVIHFHNISLFGPGVLEIEPPRGGAVKIYTTHEHWLICPTHVLWKYNRRPCEKPDCLRCTLLAKRPPQLWRYTGLLEKSSARVDQYFSPSLFTARMHAERGFPRPVGVLPYFIPRADGDWQRPAPRPQERPYFLFVGRLETIKGLQTLIPLWGQVENCDLLVAGTGTQELSLRAMAGSNPRIRFLGPQTQSALGSLYYHAVACIVPSITYETFGQISIEAFARKTPVVVRNLGALPKAVEQSGGGFVYDTDGQLLDSIRSLAASPSLRAELGEKGYRALLEYWSLEPHLTLYFRSLREIAGRRFGVIPWEKEGPRTDDPMGSKTWQPS
jgi:glycosyltransferase involved in cell wall biosynthesis